MKTFTNFISEANKYGIPDDEYKQWQQDRAKGKGPARKTFNGVEYEMRNKAGSGQPPVWAVSTVESRKASSQRRKQAEQETELTKDELLNAVGDDEEMSALALDSERSGIKKVKKRAQKSSKLSGEKKSVGHKQPLQPEDPSPEDPGHTLSNIRQELFTKNTSRKNKRPEPGESGYGLTRTQATQDAVRRGSELGKKIDREVELERQGKPSRAARLLSNLRRPKLRFKNSPERAREQLNRQDAAYDKKIDDTLDS